MNIKSLGVDVGADADIDCGIEIGPILISRVIAATTKFEL